jgi:hypothetical protein
VRPYKAGGGDIVNGTSDEGSDNDEANATRREYGTSAASNDDEAGATISRLARAARAARPADGKHPRLRHPSGRKATHAAARRSGVTKVAQRTGVSKAAANAKRDDVFFCDAYSDSDAGDDTDNDAERPRQPHNHTTNDDDNYEVEEAKGDKSAGGCRTAKKRPYTPKTTAPTTVRTRRQHHKPQYGMH